MDFVVRKQNKIAATPRRATKPRNKAMFRAVFKWLSKVITWLRLLRLVIGLKDSRRFFSQWEAKPKPFASCKRDFSRALSKCQIIARNCDWFIALFAPIVIGRSNCFGFGFGFSTVFENRSIPRETQSHSREAPFFVFLSFFNFKLFLQLPLVANEAVTIHPLKAL